MFNYNTLLAVCQFFFCIKKGGQGHPQSILSWQKHLRQGNQNIPSIPFAIRLYRMTYEKPFWNANTFPLQPLLNPLFQAIPNNSLGKEIHHVLGHIQIKHRHGRAILTSPYKQHKIHIHGYTSLKVFTFLIITHCKQFVKSFFTSCSQKEKQGQAGGLFKGKKEKEGRKGKKEGRRRRRKKGKGKRKKEEKGKGERKKESHPPTHEKMKNGHRTSLRFASLRAVPLMK
jgi:hypothetical protein